MLQIGEKMSGLLLVRGLRMERPHVSTLKKVLTGRLDFHQVFRKLIFYCRLYLAERFSYPIPQLQLSFVSSQQSGRKSNMVWNLLFKFFLSMRECKGRICRTKLYSRTVSGSKVKTELRDNKSCLGPENEIKIAKTIHPLV